MLASRWLQLREVLDRGLEHLWGSHDQPLLFSGPARTRAVALTFDDGPSAANTGPLLDLLREHGASATFFVVGDQIAGNEELLQRIVSEGHEIGNHSFSHPHTIQLGETELLRELERANEAIAVATDDVRCARPPFGKDRRRFARIAGQAGLQSVLWSIDSGDTSGRTSDEIARVIANPAAGSIILMHDGGSYRPHTLEACALVVPMLIEGGYELVRVRDLFATETRPEPHR